VARRRQFQFPALSGDEAIAALRWLVAQGQLSVRQLEKALARRDRLVREIREQLEVLGGEGVVLARGPEALNRRGRRGRPQKRVSAIQQAAWRAQGRYLAAVRRLPKAERARVRVIRKKKGMRAAMAAAKRLAT